VNFYACSVCFLGTKDDPMNTSLQMAIIFMLTVLVLVMGIFTKFFLNVRKRSKITA